jgi:hypothetical protein
MATAYRETSRGKSLDEGSTGTIVVENFGPMSSSGRLSAEMMMMMMTTHGLSPKG